MSNLVDPLVNLFAIKLRIYIETHCKTQLNFSKKSGLSLQCVHILLDPTKINKFIRINTIEKVVNATNKFVKHEDFKSVPLSSISIICSK